MATETCLTLEGYDPKIIQDKLNGQPEVDSTIRKTRFQICQGCDKLDSRWHRCSLCSCWMPVKARLPGMKCPAGKW
jgi:hypothetical protein